MNLLRRCMSRRRSQRTEVKTLTKVANLIVTLLAMIKSNVKSTILKDSPSLHKLMIINSLKPQFTAFHIISKKLLLRKRAKVGVKTKLRPQMRTKVAEKLLSKAKPLREIAVRRWGLQSLKWSRCYLSSAKLLTFLQSAKQMSVVKRASRSWCKPLLWTITLEAPLLRTSMWLLLMNLLSTRMTTTWQIWPQLLTIWMINSFSLWWLWPKLSIHLVVDSRRWARLLKQS